MAHEWKIGDWCEYRGVRGLVYLVCMHSQVIYFVTRNCGKDYSYTDSDVIKHLPDCDSWDWQPRKIEPQYRPFANAEEFKPFRDKWFRWKNDVEHTMRAGSYDDRTIWPSCASVGTSYSEAFERCEFEGENGQPPTPFGVLVEQPT